MNTESTVAVVVPNWNGKDTLEACLDSLNAQTLKHRLIVVENGSADGSLDLLRKKYPNVQLVVNKTNRGFAGGVNDGIRAAMKAGAEYVALFNNDAVAESDWLEKLLKTLEVEREYGIATCKFLNSYKDGFDSTGDMYTNWGLPFPRGRGESVSDKYDDLVNVFAASGGASLYRVKVFDEIGFFDEDFFAYYEDMDISFRAQLHAWQVRYVPGAIAYHQIGATSAKIKGFTTYQTMKNLPLLFFKNVPSRYFFSVGIRLCLAELLFFGRAVSRGQLWPAFKGWAVGKILIIKKIPARYDIQHNKKVSDAYIWDMMTHDLPPNAYSLRRLRQAWWRVSGEL